MWHVPQMAAILWDFGRRTPWLPRVRPYRTDLRVMTRITRAGWVRVLHDARGPAAFIARDGARIHALYVHPRAQGRGLGRTLLDDAKHAAPRLELWVAEANREARAFYDAQGFAEGQRSDGTGNDERLPDIQMIWQDERCAP
ncbi:Acetyltransferase (GNAT) family protein [Roseovarius nanhaiticus]|uniref:Acetyltransferase (GNAT) family protein n=2 Tax=Roseovarius nanhaiticus TaxID=573024 RepID=A0A1N7GZ66_9RHOB|nr:Acetyltransferase (GNAT) family protein [Roseovarius nanhaiticus]SIS17816.1 Acetyltransferase (GNAT) family protein [Roseovarius nanhaiticus]